MLFAVGCKGGYDHLFMQNRLVYMSGIFFFFQIQIQVPKGKTKMDGAIPVYLLPCYDFVAL